MALLLVGCGSSGGGLFSPEPVHPDAIRRACAMEVSCFPTPPISPGGACVTQFEEGLATGIGILFGPSAQDLARYIDCANSHDNCTDALNCASRNHGPSWCNAHPAPACDGDTLVGCIDGWGLSLIDCTQLGEHCGTANGASACTDGNACDPNAPARCDGSKIVSCDSATHLETRLDCAAALSGATCATTTSANGTDTSCVFSRAPGCMDETESCDGTAAVDSECGTQVLRVACGDFASHCVLDGDKADCVPNASDCDGTAPDTCSGNALQICANGKLTTTPCSDIGLTTCQAPPGGSARCN
ncbi:MAG TPA: hypothetical protein VII38_12755 [Polyangia bacterium]